MMKKRIKEYFAKRFGKLIIELYQIVRQEKKKDFVLSSKIIKVKKSKLKYKLLFIETKTGKYKFWLKDKNEFDLNKEYLMK